MPQPRVLILRAPGTNCDRETAFAFGQAGGQPDLVHINRLLENPKLIGSFQILCFPGGFSYGDDIAAGRILANQIQHHLQDTIYQFQAAKKLVLGICNGFQVLLKSGILLEPTAEAGTSATLTWNDSGRFEDRWVALHTGAPNCVFLEGIERLYLPIAHAEGKFVVRDPHVLQQLADHEQVAVRYCGTDGLPSDQPLPFPQNPNGSMSNIAGLCDRSGRVLGLMPHPERYIDATHHPRWTRGEGRQPGDGFAVFENAVGYFA